MVSFRELARRLVAEKIVETISHQRVSQLSREDPSFPPVVPVGRSNVVDWHLARPYFETREKRQGQRTDLIRKRASASESGEQQDHDDPSTED
ncbi:hypothetical protein KBY19_21255 [Streptomyces sp. B15]|nr:hypothetical protein [Streptomyces sp. B15]